MILQWKAEQNSVDRGTLSATLHLLHIEDIDYDLEKIKV